MCFALICCLFTYLGFVCSFVGLVLLCFLFFLGGFTDAALIIYYCLAGLVGLTLLIGLGLLFVLFRVTCLVPLPLFC